MSRLEKALKFWSKNPVEAIKDWFNVTPEDYQAEILLDVFVRDKDRIAAKSAHGVGKTTVLSWAGWLYLNTRINSRVVATAPTQSQLFDALWPEYAKWHQELPDELRDQWHISAGHIRNKTNPKVWFAVARTSNKPENLQGFHCQHIMVQVDEASAVAQPVFEVIEGILSSADDQKGANAEETKLLLTGNPNFTTGELYHAFHKNRDLYTRYTISGDTKLPSDPNGGTIYLSSRVKKKYRETIAKKYGDDSAVYDVRVRGVFPRQDDTKVIPFAWAEAAQYVHLPLFDDKADPITLVMDVARFGGDETVLSVFRGGHQIAMKTWPKTSTEQCADILYDEHEYWKSRRIPIERTVIDEPGVGGGVVDAARRRGLPITPYHGGESLQKDRDPDEDVRMFANRRSRDWWSLRRRLERGDIRLLQDETLINQLASVEFYYNEKEKIQVESKKDLRDRLGDDASPDRADTVVMALAPWYTYVPAGNNVSEDDVIYGEDRPRPELELW
jgi:hypothetical protein